MDWLIRSGSTLWLLFRPVILTAALAGSVRYDWVRSNTLKLVCVFVFTGIFLVVFIWDEWVRWLPGLVLVAGNMVTVLAVVKISLNISQNTM